MAASRDFNALKGTERIIVYSERRPCYPMGYVPALTANEDECVRTDCDRPYNLADPYLHGGNDPDPAATSRSNYGGDSSPTTPKTPKLAGGGPNCCFSPQSSRGKCGGRAKGIREECICQPARKRNKRLKCAPIPPDPKTGAGYPNVKQMVDDINAKVSGVDDLSDDDRRRVGGGGTWSKLGEDLTYTVQNWQDPEGQYAASPSSELVQSVTIREGRSAGGEDRGLSSCAAKPTSYERFIPSFMPVTRSGEHGSADQMGENVLFDDESRELQDSSWEISRNMCSAAATRTSCQPFNSKIVESQSGRLLRPKSMIFRAKNYQSFGDNSSIPNSDVDDLVLPISEKSSSNSKSKTQSEKKKKSEHSNAAEHTGDSKRQGGGKGKNKNRSK